MITSNLDMVLVLIASLGASLVFGGLAKAVGLEDAGLAALVGGGLPLLAAWFWHSRVVADKEASYVRQTDAKTKVTLASIDRPAPAAPPLPSMDEKLRALRDEQVLFFRAGIQAKGYSIRKLKGVIGSVKWGEWTSFYASEAGREVLTLAEGKDGYQLTPGWTEEKLLTAIRDGALPHPDGQLAGIQRYIGNAKTRQNAAEHAATVVE